MDLKSVINIILGDLKEAADLMDELKDKPDYPELRAELAKSKCRSAGDMIRLIGDILEDLKTENSEGAKENLTTGTESREKELTEKEPAETEPVEKEATEKEGEETAAESREVFNGTADTKPREDISKTEDDKSETRDTEEGSERVDDSEKKEGAEMKDITEKKEGTEQGTEKVKEKKADKIIADRFAHLSSRMNEKVGDSKKTEGKIRTIPVTDLNRALGVNDRFYFIRELFNGNAELFRETIDKLNRASTAAEAHEILSRELADMADTEAALQLFELVERKLSVK